MYAQQQDLWQFSVRLKAHYITETALVLFSKYVI